ncbi:uncharacterized protein LOC100206690 [Hydra vulgaris]|uniref:Uncharacterized protein LOC100206690 n=1 Tax=Hydra vulgaris TaxID=6087 RepID=A0ABM4BFZ7_HYDVU
MCDQTISEKIHHSYSKDKDSLFDVKKNDFLGTLIDVGTEIYVKVNKVPGVSLGLTILNQQHITPNWPIILNIDEKSPASLAQPCLNIGDRIKEIDGIPTCQLNHSEVIALFYKASDDITMTVCRVLKTNDKSFYWYRYPFLCVSTRYENVVLKNPRYCQGVLNDGNSSALDLTTFKPYKENNKVSKTSPQSPRRSTSMYSIYCSSQFEESKKYTINRMEKSLPKPLFQSRVRFSNWINFPAQKGKPVYKTGFLAENKSKSSDLMHAISGNCIQENVYYFGSKTFKRSVSSDEVLEDSGLHYIY